VHQVISDKKLPLQDAMDNQIIRPSTSQKVGDDNTAMNKLDDRVLDLADKNRLHKSEIATLKSNVHADKKVISNLKGRVAHLEELTGADNEPMNNKITLERSKRPVRLLPPHILR